MLSGEATNTNFIVFGLNRSVLEPTIYHTQGEHANHYATEAVNITIDVAIVNVKVITSVINKNELEIGMKHFCVWIEIKHDINSEIILIKYLYL